MKIIFFGTFQYSVLALEKLIRSGYEIATVVTNPDSLQGRKKGATSTPVKLAAQKFGLNILQPSRVGDMADLLPAADLGIVVAYGKIIPKGIIELPKYGTINIHPSLLPAYRGPSPIQSAILNGEKETGVTIMQIDEEVDHGPILSQATYVIPPNALHPQIATEIFQLGAELLIQTIPDWLEGKIIPRPQDHARATFTKKFSWADGRINWNQPAEKIYHQIRALNPEPGTWTTLNGKILKILKAVPLYQGSTLNLPKGRTLNFPVIPQEVQLEGKKAMPFQDFLRGISNKKLDFK